MNWLLLLFYINGGISFLFSPHSVGFIRKGNREITHKLYDKHNKKYPHSNLYYQNYIRRLNSKNTTIRDNAILEAGKGLEKNIRDAEETDKNNNKRRYYKNTGVSPTDILNLPTYKQRNGSLPNIQIIINPSVTPNSRDKYIFQDTMDILGGVFGKNGDDEKDIEHLAIEIQKILNGSNDDEMEDDNENIDGIDDDELDNENTMDEETTNQIRLRNREQTEKWGETTHRDISGGHDKDDDNYYAKRDRKTENFEVIMGGSLNFSHIGGYENVKSELYQIVDLLKNGQKYEKYNVRVPKGLIFEGPPGNGKTMFAKALAGECKTGIIAVSGSEFQDKYVGVGSGKVRELMGLAIKNKPCIIFIDEIDALGRKRTGDGESSTAEKDNTLNELLVALDGFKSSQGVFLVGATNRLDLLDTALIRPGRIDKKIHIGSPDRKTRHIILDMYLKGKPHDVNVKVEDLAEQTDGFSCAQIENTLNEAMLNALRLNHEQFSASDIETVINKQLVGWQPIEHELSKNIIDHIAIHEMGHTILGLFSKHHAKVVKVAINLHSPQSPGYTIFENTASTIFTREALFEHLMILLGGRIAEEIIYNMSITTGAINDFHEAHSLAEKMILQYGMGTKQTIYPSMSENYRHMIDKEVDELIKTAYRCAETILFEHQNLIITGAELLKERKVLRGDDLHNLCIKNGVLLDNR